MPEKSDELDHAALHGDMTRRVHVETRAMDWQPSPSGSVLRKRLHLVGGAESGQVTSLVRYLRGASFPEHPHPEGEEILVLEGTFSDHTGHALAGTHLLNPEGFRHAPYSDQGCLIFVKLRQYAGPEREHRQTQTAALAWQPGERDGIERKVLHDDPAFPDATMLERWSAGTQTGARSFPGGAELLVLSGGFEDERGRYGPLDWLRLPPGFVFDGSSVEGCTLYLKTGALPTLRSLPETVPGDV